MIRSNKNIEIVRTSMKSYSSMSQVSADAVAAVLSKHFSNVAVSIVNNLSDLEALVLRSPDLVFLGMEYVPINLDMVSSYPHKVWLSDFLDAHDIAYTGSSQTAIECGRSKQMAKQCLVNAKLRTPAFCTVKQGRLLSSRDITLKYPLFVKPTNLGGGQGIDSDSVVHNFEQLYSKVNAIAAQLHADSLVEEYLPGREYSVAILQDEDTGEYKAYPLELIAPPDKHGARILSNEIKSSNVEQAAGVIDPIIRLNVVGLAISAFNALGARDYGRIDIRLDDSDVPYFLEANFLPSLICGYGSFPKACMLNGSLAYEPMIMRIAQLGLRRTAESGIGQSLFLHSNVAIEAA